MRIGLLMGLAPRKLGSFETWALALCKEALWRGHQVDLFGRSPVHPTFAQTLRSLGVGWGLVDELEQDVPRAARLLASRYDVLHLNFVPPRGRAALAAYAAWPARVLFMARSDGPAPSGRLAAAARRALNRLAMIRVDGLAGVSNYVRERERLRFGLGPSRARTLYNGVDLQRFRPRPPSDARYAGANVLVVAYLTPHKGVHHAINAFARLRHPDARLTIVGDGPEAPRLEALARSRGVRDRVLFLGLRDDLPAQMNDADLFVHTSLVEGFGLAVAEAMASGRAVIASRVGGIPELIEDGQSGLLVPPGDEERLAAAMDLLLSNPSYRRELEEAAHQRARERFNLRVTVRQHLDWCEEAFTRRPRRAGETLERLGVLRSDRPPANVPEVLPSWVPGAHLAPLEEPPATRRP